MLNADPPRPTVPPAPGLLATGLDGVITVMLSPLDGERSAASLGWLDSWAARSDPCTRGLPEVDDNRRTRAGGIAGSGSAAADDAPLAAGNVGGDGMESARESDLMLTSLDEGVASDTAVEDVAVDGESGTLSSLSVIGSAVFGGAPTSPSSSSSSSSSDPSSALSDSSSEMSCPSCAAPSNASRLLFRGLVSTLLPKRERVIGSCPEPDARRAIGTAPGGLIGVIGVSGVRPTGLATSFIDGRLELNGENGDDTAGRESFIEGRLEPGGDFAVLRGVSAANGLTGPSWTDDDGLREGAGEAKVGVAGPTCPWSSICSLAASSWRHILQRMRRRGPPGVAGAESEGVRGNFAKKSVSIDPSPSVRHAFWYRGERGR